MKSNKFNGDKYSRREVTMIDKERIFFQKTFIVILLVLLTLIAFYPVLNNQFINFDDPGYVAKNEHVQSGITFDTIVWAFTSTEQSNWHPLTWISHALDCTLFGVNPGYHHAMNLFLHVLSSVVLFLAFERMTRNRWQSIFIALIFAIHPLHVESVAWVAERKDVLSGFFWMLTILAYATYRRSPTFGRYLVTLCLFALGLLAKPMLITLPLVLILLDYWPLQALHQRPDGKKRGWLKTIMGSIPEKIPFFILSIASSIVTYLVQRRGGSMAESTILAFSDRFANAIISYVTYIWKTIYPTDLAIFYPHPGNNIVWWHLALSVFLLPVVTLYVWRQKTRRPYYLVGWSWFIITLIPVIGLVQVGLQSMADRYMYIPMIGLSIMAAWGVPDLLNVHLLSRRYLLIGASILCTVLMMFGTYAQAGYWSDSVTLFEHALTVTSGNHLAHNNLGVALEDSGKHREAIAHLRAALALRPNEILIHSNLARSLAALGERHEALEHYKWILSRVPPDPLLEIRIGDILADDGSREEAIVHFKEAIRLDPGNPYPRCQLAELYAFQPEYDSARSLCLSALNLQPQYSEAHRILGIIAGRQQLYDEAIHEFTEAIRYDSSNADPYYDLGILYDRMGKSEDASVMYREAVKRNSGHTDALLNLGIVLARKGEFDEAAMWWQRAAAVNPDALNVRLNLARLYEIQGKIGLAISEYAEIVRIDPGNAQYHYSYGSLLAKQDRFAEAELHFREAIRITPTFRPALEALQRLANDQPR